jgi:hypothetical protein
MLMSAKNLIRVAVVLAVALCLGLMAGEAKAGPYGTRVAGVSAGHGGYHGGARFVAPLRIVSGYSYGGYYAQPAAIVTESYTAPVTYSVPAPQPVTVQEKVVVREVAPSYPQTVILREVTPSYGYYSSYGGLRVIQGGYGYGGSRIVISGGRAFRVR